MNDRVIMLRDILAKFNMYHDRRGRFAHAPDRGGPGAANASPKQQKRINEFKKKLRAGYADSVPLRRREGIDKHDPSKAEFGKYAQLRKLKGKPPQSQFTVRPDSLEKEVRAKLKEKSVPVKYRGIDEFYVVVNLDKTIGKSYDVNTKKMVETSRITVVFSERNGMHYYPSMDDE